MSLQPGDLSSSQDRMRAVWSDPENFKRGSEYDFMKLINHESDHGLPHMGEAKKLCFRLYEDTRAPALHVTRLDRTYSDTFRLGNLGRARGGKPGVEQKVLSSTFYTTPSAFLGVCIYH